MKQVLWIDWEDGQTVHELPKRIKPIKIGQQIVVGDSPFECWYIEELQDGTRNVRVEPINHPPQPTTSINS